MPADLLNATVGERTEVHASETGSEGAASWHKQPMNISCYTKSRLTLNVQMDLRHHNRDTAGFHLASTSRRRNRVIGRASRMRFTITLFMPTTLVRKRVTIIGSLAELVLFCRDPCHAVPFPVAEMLEPSCRLPQNRHPEFKAFVIHAKL